MMDASRLDLESIRARLHARFGEDIGAIQPLAGGIFSRACAFTAAGREYVIRISAEAHAAESFEKDRYAGERFSSPALPIPRIIETGSTGDTCCAISYRVPGRPLIALPAGKRRALLPAVLDTLEAVGRADVRDSSGYGSWGPDGNGRFDSWQGFLAAAIENDTDGYYKNWHELFRHSFLERELYEAVYRQMLELAARCPEQRALIHNDFHFENVLTDGVRVSGVVDWANALYGDPLYDVAWLGWLSVHPGWWYDNGVAVLEQRFGDWQDYGTRIACYQCHVGLDHLRFYAKNGRRGDYEFCRDWLLSIIFA